LPGEGLSGRSSMRVRVLYFASFRELLGVGNEDLQIPSGSTVGAVLERIKKVHSELTETEKMLVAVNGSFVESGLLLSDGDVVAFFPPVSGG
jgi:molybdopterin synthase sulfur carrier subunit